jgi:hypothetical protein
MAETVVQFKATTPLEALHGKDLEEQCIMRVRWKARDAGNDCRDLCENLHEWLQVSVRSQKQHYMRVAESWDDFCKRYVDRCASFVDAMLAGYKVLDKAKAIPIEQALEAAKARDHPLKAHQNPDQITRDVHGRYLARDSSKGDGVTFGREPRGNAQSYLLRRLARDHEGIFNAFEAGEFPSVRQAALAAGIVTDRRLTLPDDPEKAAALLATRFEATYLIQLATRLLQQYTGKDTP